MIAFVEEVPRDRVAILEPERGLTVSYGDLVALVDATANRLLSVVSVPSLVFLVPSNDLGGVVWYLACLRAGCPVALLEPNLDSLAIVAGSYRPRAILLPDSVAAPPGCIVEAGQGLHAYQIWRAPVPSETHLHPDLAVLLPTSGSTGNPKLVRLSINNLSSNAVSICEYLEIDGHDCAIQSLPMHYAYGLSVLNSHLAAGASVVLTSHSFMRPDFWRIIDGVGCTSFAGVPYMYQTLHRLRFNPSTHRSLRTYTQAGGALSQDLTMHYRDATVSSKSRFFVMYGQTEATARISYVPPKRLVDKIGTIGISIPGGSLSLRPVDEGEGLQELIYHGPNVMLGYATSVADLELGDVQQGILATGDLGFVDTDSFYTIVGRLKRFAKLFGRRVNLEDIERFIESRHAVVAAAVDGGDRVIVYLAPHQGAVTTLLAGELARFVGVPPKAVVLRTLDAIPMTVTGKKNYKALENAAS